MSLKAKLEAVIYAAEEPVTLTQLAALFAADALEWKAAQQAAAAEQTAEVAGVPPSAAEPRSLLDEGLEYLGLAETPAVYTSEPPPSLGADVSPECSAEPSAPAMPGTLAGSDTEPAPSGEIVSFSEGAAYPSIVVRNEALAQTAGDPEATSAEAESELKRLARQRDREVKAVLKQLLDELIASYAADGRGVEIREIAGGYRMATKPECHDAVRLFVKSLKPALKLSLPALETLAVIAYKQPVTAPEVNEIRGVESSGVLGGLLARKLIATAGRKPVIGRPILYKTTKEFLLRFGLKDVSELPSMEEFEKMAATELELEPEAVEADNREEGASGFDESAEGELDANSPSGQELAATTEMVERAGENHAASETKLPERPADALQPASPEGVSVAGVSEGTPAAPESTPQAEIEAMSDAEKEKEPSA